MKGVMNKPTPFIAPDTEDEPDWQEERERKRKALTRDTIRDMVSDALEVNQDQQTACEHLTVGKAFNERTAERHLEANE